VTSNNAQDEKGVATSARSSSRRVILLALLIGLAAGVLTVALVNIIPNAPSVGQTTGKAAIGGPFTLTDGAGRHVTEKDFAGKPMLVFFGFTHCPDVCPAGLQVMAAALDQLGDKAAGMTPIFITVDPERDTPEVVDKYVKSFHPAIVGLSGTPDEVAGAIRAYRVYAKKQPADASSGQYSVDHSTFMYVMDAKGEYVTHFTHMTDADEIAKRMSEVIGTSVRPAQL